MRQDNPSPYQTSDTSFASYLLYHDHKVVGMKQDPSDVKRLVYVFIEKDDTQEVSKEFYYGEPNCDPRKFFKCSKEIFKVLRTHKEKMQ